MPPISKFYCDNTDCSFEGPEGWGYYMYAIADDGERVVCPHPGELQQAREVIGYDASDAEVDERTGFNYHCVCVDCAALFDLDPRRDPVECPECSSRAVTGMLELVDSPCPACGEGMFVEEDTGAIA